ncbi:unnamed protein product [Clavelina lepadiformis]|uniref:Axonemal dynein light chain domain-containing protein 1 n=1 Tax=Clavelina lepadiformis TaxID=159417 RepID=A0ABP0GGV8_CLALP
MSIQASRQTADKQLSVTLQNENTPPDDGDMSMQPYDENFDGKKALAVQNEMIPDELLFALTESEQDSSYHKENKLGPVRDKKTPEKLRMALKKSPPANVWHHKSRRTQFRHLTDFPRSLGKGIGTRDVSFLYDVATQPTPKPSPASRFDKSAIRLEASQQAIGTRSSGKLAVPDSIIPEEYHIVKSKAVLGLEYIDEDLTTKLADREQTLRLFPSLLPTKRFEVIQLLQTLDAMLEQSGVEDECVEVKGPTQIHNLLELIKKEQNIYDLVFSEVIRQVSIECVERGQLLSKLRQKYAEILSKVPRQIKSLHAEVIAQRSLDRRLTEELLRFKSSITFLTTELQTVREHDKQVTKDAATAEEELSKALKESQTNANLVDEYHELYELQRRRLESSVASLTAERDLWSNAAYSLSHKITTLNSLTTAKRLHVSEKAWSKLSNHFTVMLSDHDSQCLSTIQRHVEEWRKLMFHFNQSLESADKHTIDTLLAVKNGMEKWMSTFEDTLMNNNYDVRSIKIPPKEMVQKLCDDLKAWEEKLSDDSERFGGDLLLTNQEQLNHMTKEAQAWTEIGWEVYRRHKTDNGESFPLSKTMMNLNDTLHKLVKQLQIRISGENGVAKGMINLQNNLDAWGNKLIMMLHGSEVLTETEWLLFYDRLSEYIALIHETLECIGSQQRDEDRLNATSHTHIAVEDTMKSVQDWMKSSLNQIDAEDGKLMAQVTSVHTDMVHWMVQMLLHLAPDHESNLRDFPSETSLVTSCTVEELTRKARTIAGHLSSFTSYFSECGSGIVQSTMQAKKDQGDDDADHEYRDFLRVKREAKEWIHTSELLLSSIKKEEVKILDKVILSRLHLPETKKPTRRRTLAKGLPEVPSEVQVEEDAENSQEQKVEDVQEVEKMETDNEQSISEATPDIIQINEESDHSAPILPARMEVIGTDENVQVAPILEDSGEEGSSDHLTPPSSSLTQIAFDAIAKMDQVQDQLLATEKRAQKAEERVTNLEEDLNSANEKVRAMEKKIAALESQSELERKEKAEVAKVPSPSPQTQTPAPVDEPKPPTTSKRNTDTTKRAPSRGSPGGKKRTTKKT